MKKLALLISFMIIFALSSFAQIDVAVEGNAEMTIGIDLDNPAASGITNATSSKISFSLASGDSEKGGDEAVYGWIKLGGWKVEANSADGWTIGAPGVEAKIMFAGGWVSITGAATSVNYVNPVEDNDGNDDATDEGLKTSLGSSGGFTVGLDIAPAAIEIGLFSENDWTQSGTATDASSEWGWVDTDSDVETAPVWAETVTPATDATDDYNNEHAYGASVKAVVAAGPATIEVAAVMGLSYPDGTPIGIGTKISLAAGPATINVMADIQIATANEFEVGADISMALVDGLTASAAVSYNDATTIGDDLDVKVAITEDGAGGVVPDMGLGLTVYLNNLMNTLAWKIEVTADYATPSMKPYAKYTVNDATLMTLKVGAELYAIQNVVFDVNYESTDLGGADNGIFKIITKIAY